MGRFRLTPIVIFLLLAACGHGGGSQTASAASTPSGFATADEACSSVGAPFVEKFQWPSDGIHPELAGQSFVNCLTSPDARPATAQFRFDNNTGVWVRYYPSP